MWPLNTVSSTSLTTHTPTHTHTHTQIRICSQTHSHNRTHTSSHTHTWTLTLTRSHTAWITANNVYLRRLFSAMTCTRFPFLPLSPSRTQTLPKGINHVTSCFLCFNFPFPFSLPFLCHSLSLSLSLLSLRPNFTVNNIHLLPCPFPPPIPSSLSVTGKWTSVTAAYTARFIVHNRLKFSSSIAPSYLSYTLFSFLYFILFYFILFYCSCCGS